MVEKKKFGKDLKVVKSTKTLELALWVLPWDASDTEPEMPTEWTALVSGQWSEQSLLRLWRSKTADGDNF